MSAGLAAKPFIELESKSPRSGPLTPEADVGDLTV